MALNCKTGQALSPQGMNAERRHWSVGLNCKNGQALFQPGLIAEQRHWSVALNRKTRQATLGLNCKANITN